MARLKIVAGEGVGTEYPLGTDPVLIGRRASSHICIDNTKVSRTHAQVQLSDGHYVVTDMESSNGTYVNNERIETPYRLKPGDEIRVGGVSLRFFSEEERPIPKVFVPGYTIKEVIAQGGMGTVFKATQNSMDRDVALKVLHQEYARRREFVDRFVQEARSAGKMAHPNIIGVHDVGKAGDTYYFSMELVDGEDLSQITAQRDIEYPEALETAAKAADALQYAHERGIVHRDIKPDNIMVTKNGDVKVADLGIAKLFEMEEPKQTGKKRTVLGTPHYMAPEQARGLTVDGRSDLYSLGATIYHILAGHPPFKGKDNQEIMTKHITETPTPLTEENEDIPAAVEQVVAKLMAKKPDDRYASAAEAAEALRDAAKAKVTAFPGAPKPPRPIAAPRGKGTRTNTAAVRTRTARKKSGAGMQIGVFVGMVVVGVIILKMVVGGDGNGSGAPDIEKARRALKKAEAVEASGDTGAAIEAYRNVAEAYPNVPSVANVARRKRDALIRHLESLRNGSGGGGENGNRPDPREERMKRAWSEYEEWRSRNPENDAEARERLETLGAAWPELKDRVGDALQALRERREEKARDLEDAWAAAEAAAKKAFEEGRLDDAVAALLEFRKERPGARDERIDAFMKRARDKAQRLFDAAREEAEAHRRTDHFGEAVQAYRDFNEAVRFREMNEQALAAIDALSVDIRAAEERLRERATAAMHRADFKTARRIFEDGARPFEGLESGERMKERVAAVRTLESLHEALVSAMKKVVPVKLPRVLEPVVRAKLRIEDDRRKAIHLVDVDEMKGLSVMVSRVETRLAWNDIPPAVMQELFKSYLDLSDDRVARAARMHALVFGLEE